MSAPDDRTRELADALRHALAGEVAFDRYSRGMFATDASMYSIEPVGVAFPRHRVDVQAAVEIAGRFDVPVLPRGAGTSLAGQTVGHAVVLDFSRHMRDIVVVDREAATARVQPGVVQDDLNRAVAPHGLLFAPDTSTGNRATIGGMIGNNSCGARSARYGMTIDHVHALDVVLSDAGTARFEDVSAEEAARRSGDRTLEARLYRDVPRLVEGHADVIRAGLPSHWRRSGGYRLERLLPEAGPFNLSNVVVGSEGTLAVVTEATVRLVPRPGAIAALVGHFTTVDEAIEAAPTALAEGATTVELVDKTILDLARRSPVHRHLAALLHGDPGAILQVEFYGADQVEAAAGVLRLQARWKAQGRGYAVLAAPTAREQAGFQALRKAGLGLLMSAGQGGERSIAFVEDTAVAPERLAEYTRRFAAILDEHGLHAGFYGHASAGCLHVRPFMNLARPGEPDRMRSVAEAVLALVMEFDGMNASEHGDGLVRGEFSPRFFGAPYYGVMQELKLTFDPRGRFNPGKKVDVQPMTENLRDPALPAALPVVTHFAFGEGGMRGAANQCMRIGACRKSPGGGGTMCPSYMATKDEEHSTRGRANALVAALSTSDPRAALGDARLHEVLDLCLECKACKTECPLGVDMATLKSEALAHHHEQHGVPLRTRMFGNVRVLNRVGSALAPLSNLPGGVGLLRALMERTVGIDRRRPLPRFRRDTLPRWFRGFQSVRAGRSASSSATSPNTRSRGPLLFLADCFTSYTEPEIGRASIELLDAAGWDVELVEGVCCGRSLISKGMLDQAWAGHRTLIRRLAGSAEAGTPIVGCEPSCVLTLRDELPALAEGSATPDEARAARAVGARARLVDDVLADALEDGTLRPDAGAEVAGRPIVFHGHCHQKAAGALDGTVRLLRRVPGATVDVLDAGCCGMAGSFGFEREHYDLSMTIGGQRLFPAVERAPGDAIVVATGVSCRQQISHGTGRVAVHPATLLRKAVRLP
jgi:FAD/FMN-containing dehydrogenase/Fe-S oxidoreductase